MSNSNSGKSNTGILIAVVAVVALLAVSSSAIGGIGYMQGWFGAGAPVDILPIDTVAPLDAAAADTAAVNYQGLSTSCAISYKPASDQFNTAVPPFDPSKCQGVEIESNCQTWTPVQQGTTWQWQKSNNIDGCIPVQPDTVGVAKGQMYMTDVGPVVPFPTVAGSAAPGEQSGGGYGKDGRWRNAADSTQIVALARSGRLRAGGRTSSTAKKMAAARPAARMATAAPRRATASKPAVRRANADPAPVAMNTPAYSQFAPYISGLVN
jgi:hypothetical protein